MCLRLLALQEEEEEEKPAHYKLFPLYEGYLEVRKSTPEKVPIAQGFRTLSVIGACSCHFESGAPF